MNRAACHDAVSKFRSEGAGEVVTYLVTPDDPRLKDVPVLNRAASWWLAGLSQRMRNCFHCGSSLPDRRYIGLLLLSTPGVPSPALASVSGLCLKCANLPAETLERAAAAALRTVAPGARFE
jgi:hypothetical protein